MLALIYRVNTMMLLTWWHKEPGGFFNIKMLSYQYRDSHCIDMVVSWLSYIFKMGIPIPEKMAFILKQGPGKQPWCWPSSPGIFLNQFAKRWQFCTGLNVLTHWGRVTHICIVKLTIIGSDNGLLPGQRQAIVWTSAGILFIGPLGTNFSEMLIRIQTFSFKENASVKWRPFCLSLMW